MAKPSNAARQAIIDKRPGNPDFTYGEPSTCPDCGRTTLEAKWHGLHIHLEAQQVPATDSLTGANLPGALQWHDLPIGEWCQLVGPRTWREVRRMHYPNCPARNTSAGPTQTKGNTT